MHFWHRRSGLSCGIWHQLHYLAFSMLLRIRSPVRTMAGAVWLYLSCKVVIKLLRQLSNYVSTTFPKSSSAANRLSLPNCSEWK